jgi:hypothetical protein
MEVILFAAYYERLLTLRSSGLPTAAAELKR